MSTYSTTRPLDLGQLAVELGSDALSMSDNGTERTVTCHDATVTQEQLEAAVEAHVPLPPPPSPASLIQAQIDELTDLTFSLMEGM